MNKIITINYHKELDPFTALSIASDHFNDPVNKEVVFCRVSNTRSKYVFYSPEREDNERSIICVYVKHPDERAYNLAPPPRLKLVKGCWRVSENPIDLSSVETLERKAIMGMWYAALSYAHIKNISENRGFL